MPGRGRLSPGWPPIKHAGLASKRGRLSAVIAHLAKVNGWSPDDAGLYLEGVFETWAARSRHQWTLDISLLSALRDHRHRPLRRRACLIRMVVHGSRAELTATATAVLPGGRARRAGSGPAIPQRPTRPTGAGESGPWTEGPLQLGRCYLASSSISQKSSKVTKFGSSVPMWKPEW